jgi:assimilatory nitrate reductase catalytic subunit
VSKQPELKHATVRIEAAQLPWRLVILRSTADYPDSMQGGGVNAKEQVLIWRARLEPMLGDFGYASLTLDGHERPLLALRLAVAAPLLAERIEAIATALDMPEAACLNYRDSTRHIVKRAIIEDGRLTGILLAGEDAASGWLRTALRDGIAIEALRRWLFAPQSTPPIAAAAPRRMICNCFDIGADEIAQEIRAGKTLPEVQMKLKCGTSCGSCLTEIRRMLVQPVVG